MFTVIITIQMDRNTQVFSGINGSIVMIKVAYETVTATVCSSTLPKLKTYLQLQILLRPF